MNNRQRNQLIAMFIALVIVIGGIITLSYVLSLHKVTFTNTESIAFSLSEKADGSDKQVSTISSSITVKLKNGTYCLVPKDTQYTQTPDCFTVKDKDLTKMLHPFYSTSKLSELQATEQSTLDSLITVKYGLLINNYVLKPGQLFERGDWYGATLTTKVAANDQGDVYRTILHKVNNVWVIVAYPQLAVSKAAYPTVPHDVLDGVNALVGNY